MIPDTPAANTTSGDSYLNTPPISDNEEEDSDSEASVNSTGNRNLDTNTPSSSPEPEAQGKISPSVTASQQNKQQSRPAYSMLTYGTSMFNISSWRNKKNGGLLDEDVIEKRNASPIDSNNNTGTR